jgi:hypothetical protein
MSHNATNWAVKQRGLKPAAKIVLWHLADRHNPDFGCFPSQATLAYDCEMSERSVRDQLEKLETCGLIVRIKRKGEGGAYMSDRYMLGCEKGFAPSPAAKSASGKNALEPAANSRNNQRQILPPNLVSEPVKEPVIYKGGSAKQISLGILSKVVSPDVAQGFVEMRWSIRKPLTEYMAKLIAGKLEGRSNADDIVNKSIENSWAGVFPDNKQINGGQNGTRTNDEQAARAATDAFIKQNDEATRIAIARRTGRA